jgi:hypothetical protein
MGQGCTADGASSSGHIRMPNRTSLSGGRFCRRGGKQPSPVHPLWVFLLMKDLRKQMGPSSGAYAFIDTISPPLSDASPKSSIGAPPSFLQPTALRIVLKNWLCVTSPASMYCPCRR